MAADDGQGTVLTLAGWTAELISVDGWSLSRDSFETSHMGTTTAKTFTPADLEDNGELNCVFEFEGADAPPIGSAPASGEINWAGGGTGDKWTATMHMINFEPGATMGERMTASATFKISGDVGIS